MLQNKVITALLSILYFFSFPVSAQSLPKPELITDRQGLPQGFVPGIVQDQKGFIWMATRDGLCRYDGTRFKVFRIQLHAAASLSFSDLRALQPDHRGNIWITSEQADIARFDPQTEKFTNFSSQVFRGLPLHKLQIQHCYPDNKNRLWIALDRKGLLCYDMSSGKVRWFSHRQSDPGSLASDQARYIIQDKKGAVWIATSNGLDLFEETTGNFRHHQVAANDTLTIPENDLYTLFLRPSGEILIGSARFVTRFNPDKMTFRSYRLPADGEILWGMRFATDSKGTVYFDQRDRLFRFSDQAGPELLERFNAHTGLCTSLWIDRSDVLWIGTDGSGIRKYDLRADGFQTRPYKVNFQTDLLSHWLHVPSSMYFPTLLSDPYMFRYSLDRKGSLWANVGTSVVYHIDPATHRVERADFPLTFVQTICPMSTDQSGRLWLLYLYDLWWYDTSQRKWIRSDYHFDGKSTDTILQMVTDDDAFWFATRGRGLFRLDRKSGSLKQYAANAKVAGSLNNNALFCLSQDPSDFNRLWIGTFGSGLCAFDKRSGKFRSITESDGLPNNVVYSVIPDQQGYLWIGTNKGLCRMHRKSFKMQSYTTEDGLLANEFNRFHYIQLPNDQIIMGGVEGLTAFFPTQLKEDSFQPRLELTALYVNNRLIVAADSMVLNRPVHASNMLKLPYDKNFVTVQFAALQYNRPGKNRYRYQLTGIDKEWVESNQPQAVYTSLPPGSYTLQLNASNTSGRWSPHVRKLAIMISPPWWNTWWAIVFYAFILACVVWYGIRLYVNRLRLQQAVDLRQQEARQLRELDEMKSRFFTNITHDFRTPLTMILSPIDGLLDETPEGTTQRKRLESIRRNAKQLLNLINQLLDFAKLDAKAVTVLTSRGDLSAFVNRTIDLFRFDAISKNISLQYHSDLTEDYWFDAGKLERILSNLIANALKFTPADGHVVISLTAGKDIRIIISDTGTGIAPERLSVIFDRFSQGFEKPSNGTIPQEGTGIGLALVKELVLLQHGKIDLKSEPGQGTTFTITLPYQLAAEPQGEFKSIELVTAFKEAPETASKDELPHLLLVEDNQELAAFIVESLPKYRISLASNGAEGLEQAFADLPDLVISDVMMPVMDGFILCQRLKSDERTNHIPVMLLTARSAFESRLEGLSFGADEYLTKPFHVQELRLRINNLIDSRNLLRERMRIELSLPESTETATPEAKPVALFLQKIYQAIENKLDDSSFTVEQLAEEMNMSRVHLHRKVKALTGLSSSEVIRNYRLKRSIQYLGEGLNNSETAYCVGFDSPSYFAKCFREVYHLSPGEFVRQK